MFLIGCKSWLKVVVSKISSPNFPLFFLKTLKNKPFVMSQKSKNTLLITCQTAALFDCFLVPIPNDVTGPTKHQFQQGTTTEPYSWRL